MKSRSCGLVQRIGAADSARPHPDPSGGQAPALHFLIPPSTIGLQFGTFRRGEPALRLIGGHILVRMTNWAPARYVSKRNRPARMRGWPSTSMSQSVGMVSTWTLARQVAPVSSG